MSPPWLRQHSTAPRLSFNFCNLSNPQHFVQWRLTHYQVMLLFIFASELMVIGAKPCVLHPVVQQCSELELQRQWRTLGTPSVSQHRLLLSGDAAAEVAVKLLTRQGSEALLSPTMRQLPSPLRSLTPVRFSSFATVQASVSATVQASVSQPERESVLRLYVSPLRSKINSRKYTVREVSLREFQDTHRRRRTDCLMIL